VKVIWLKIALKNVNLEKVEVVEQIDLHLNASIVKKMAMDLVIVQMRKKKGCLNALIVIKKAILLEIVLNLGSQESLGKVIDLL
jgi:hypothetical protein